MSSSRSRRSVAALTAAGLLLGACSGAESSSEPAARPSATSPSPTPTTPPPPPPRWPLTGKVAERGLPKRPVLVVKVDNTGESVPQRGVGKADLVVEELVEGGRTRLAVFLHSRLPKVIGPVRSQRTSDIGIVKPARAVLVASGAAGLVERKMRRAEVRFLGEGARGYFRDGGRPAPYNLMVRPGSTVKAVARHPRPQHPYLQFAKPEVPVPEGRPARRALVRFSPYQTTSWRYAPGRGWVSPSSRTRPGRGFVAHNVLAIHVRIRDAGYRDPAGSFVPETVTSGSGKVTLMHDGRAVDGRWHKRSPRSPFRFTTQGGAPLPVPPGRTWIELVPKSGKVSVR